MPKLIIDSADREGSSTAPNTTSRVNYDWKAQKPLNRVRTMILDHVQVPKHPTVITGWNDEYCFSEDAGAGHVLHVATIPPGYYTPSTLATALGTAMTTESAGANLYSASWDSTTNKISITSTAGGALDDPYKIEYFQGQTSEARLRCAKLFGASVEAESSERTVPDTSALTYQVQMNSPRYYTLVVDTGYNADFASLTNTQTYTFIVPAPTNELYEVIDRSRNDDYDQGEMLTDGFVQKINIRWYYENTDTLAPEWENLEHLIVLQID